MPTTRLIVDAHEEAASTATVDKWAPVRHALLGPPQRHGGVDEAPTISGVWATLDAALPLFSGDRLSEVGTPLPSLLRDADDVAHLGPEGRAVRARLLHLTGWLLTQTRQLDAAEEALERALDHAPDRVQAATTVSTMCWLLLRRGRLALARELATHWADVTEPRMSKATPAELSACVWLLLRASAAAIRDAREGEADDTLRYARTAAVAMGREYAPKHEAAAPPAGSGNRGRTGAGGTGRSGDTRGVVRGAEDTGAVIAYYWESEPGVVEGWWRTDLPLAWRK
ncbi:hypothetical protein ACWCQS_08945 [Streptomyces sp. NPDC002076]